MAEHQGEHREPHSAESSPATGGVSSELRGKLLARLAMAGTLVVVLLGVLAFFDYLANPPAEETEGLVFTKPVPVAPRKEISQPVTPAESLPEPPVQEKDEATAEPPPPPVIDTHPVTPPEALRESGLAHRAGPKAEPVSSQSAPKPSTDTVALAPVESLPEATSSPSNIPAPRQMLPPPARPASPVVEVKPAPAVMPPSAPRLFSGFLLQAGVFSSARRAEELHARLTMSGVPSTLETRVQVGPFKTKREAEAAQEKLKELGVETILVPPRGKGP